MDDKYKAIKQNRVTPVFWHPKQTELQKLLTRLWVVSQQQSAGASGANH